MQRLLQAFKNSLSGLYIAYKEETAFKQEVFLSILLIPLAVFTAKDQAHLLLMIGSVLILLITELLNTAIEATIDYISMERHPLAKKAKDTASAAVLIALFFVVICYI